MKRCTRLESSIERAGVQWLRERGCLVRKMNGLGFAGWPDRLVILPTGVIFWIEFKRSPKHRLSKRQELLHKMLRGHHQHVFVCTDTEEVAAAYELVGSSTRVYKGKSQRVMVNAR